MTDLELMGGFLAYDQGCVDSGIYDEISKKELFKKFHNYTDGIHPVITEHATWLLSENGKKQGYSVEDVKSFIDWLADNGYDL